MSWFENYDSYSPDKKNLFIFSFVEKYDDAFNILEELIDKSISLLYALKDSYNLIFLAPYRKEYRRFFRNQFDGVYFFSDHIDLIDLNFDIDAFYIFDTNTGIYNLNEFSLTYKDYDIYSYYTNIKDFYLKNYDFFSSHYYWFDDDYIENEYKLSVKYLEVYKILDKLFETRYSHIKKYQFLSDPVDYKFKNVDILTPDSEVIPQWTFFPAYQYYYFIVKEKQILEYSNKKHKLIFGNTCESIYRNSITEQYLYPIYVKKKKSNDYRMYFKNFHTHNEEIDNYIPYNNFLEEISLSKVGIVLNTYSKEIISMNKVSMFLSNNTIPIFTPHADKMSMIIPDELKDELTFNDSNEIIDWVESLDKEKYEYFLNLFNVKFSNLRNHEFYDSIINELFL